jgi:hypothetical protein
MLLATTGLAVAFLVAVGLSALDSLAGVAGNNEGMGPQVHRWLGKRFGLLDRTNIGNTLAVGRWIVLLHRRGCPVCREEAERLANIATELTMGNDSTRTALVEVLDGTAQGGGLERAGERCLSGFVQVSRGWRIATPLTLLIQDGVVLDVSYPTNS